MNIIRKIIPIILAVTVFLSGCTTDNSIKTVDDNVIIHHYVTQYSNSTNSQNDDIAAILREFSYYVINNRPSSWPDLQGKENQFMSRLLTNEISYYYPVIPSDEEIRISDGFLDIVITYDSIYHPEWIYSVNQRIPSISSRFITQMNDYEYNTRTNK